MPKQLFIGEIFSDTDIVAIGDLESVIIVSANTARNQGIKHGYGDVSHKQPPFLYRDVRRKTKEKVHACLPCALAACRRTGVQEAILLPAKIGNSAQPALSLWLYRRWRHYNVL